MSSIKKSEAGKFLDRLHAFFQKSRTGKPYFHVSDPLRNDEELASAFSGQYHGYIRTGAHPDHKRLEEWLTDFENGAMFRVRSDGMGAVAMALHTAVNLKGKHLIGLLPLYGGTYDLLKFMSIHCGVRHTLIPANDEQLAGKISEAITPETAAIIFETTANPTLVFPDITTIVQISKTHHLGKPILICDNTFQFGIFKAFHYGIDVIVGSGTKYLAGESTWSLGYCGVSKNFLFENPDFWKEANLWANLHGGTLGPFEAWVTGKFATQDVKKRIEIHSNNALYVSKFLEKHPAVERVLYPGLHPNAKSAAMNTRHFLGKPLYGGMVSFYLKAYGNTTNRLLYYLTANTHIENKASLGGPDDMVENPYFLSHHNMTEEDKICCGITPNLIRLSVGRLRHPKHTVNALDKALRAVVK